MAKEMETTVRLRKKQQQLKDELLALRAEQVQLRREVDFLTEVLDSNSKIFTDTFVALETQIHILQRAVADAICNGGFQTMLTADGSHHRIDIETYLVQYSLCLSLGAWVRKFLDLDNVQEKPPVESSYDTIEFGG